MIIHIYQTPQNLNTHGTESAKAIIPSQEELLFSIMGILYHYDAYVSILYGVLLEWRCTRQDCGSATSRAAIRDGPSISRFQFVFQVVLALDSMQVVLKTSFYRQQCSHIPKQEIHIMILKVCMGAHTHYFLNILRFIFYFLISLD